jgi:hypothetical protein
MLGTRVALALVCAALTPELAVAQRPLLVRHYSLPTMDIGILADTAHGVSFVTAPSVLTREGNQAAKITWIRFDPQRLLQWLDSADVYLRAPVRANEADGTRWAPRLIGIGGRGWLTFGRGIRKHRLDKHRYAFVTDSAYSWRFEVSEEQAQGLLNLLLEAAALSRLRPLDSATHDGVMACDDVDRPVEVEYQPQPRVVGGLKGRVATQYVVDATGRPEMDAFVAVFATDPALEEAARTLIAQSRFKPAVLREQSVRQLVQQMVVWR